MPVSPAMLAMLMTRPLRRGCMSRSASRVPWKAPSRWTRSIRCQRSSDSRDVASSEVVTRPVCIISVTCARVRSSVSGSVSAKPALFTITSSCPPVAPASTANQPATA